MFRVIMVQLALCLAFAAQAQTRPASTPAQRQVTTDARVNTNAAAILNVDSELKKLRGVRSGLARTNKLAKQNAEEIERLDRRIDALEGRLKTGCEGLTNKNEQLQAQVQLACLKYLEVGPGGKTGEAQLREVLKVQSGTRTLKRVVERGADGSYKEVEDNNTTEAMPNANCDPEYSHSVQAGPNGHSQYTQYRCERPIEFEGRIIRPTPPSEPPKTVMKRDGFGAAEYLTATLIGASVGAATGAGIGHATMPEETDVENNTVTKSGAGTGALIGLGAGAALGFGVALIIDAATDDGEPASAAFGVTPTGGGGLVTYGAAF